jgi:cytochrome c2
MRIGAFALLGLAACDPGWDRPAEQRAEAEDRSAGAPAAISSATAEAPLTVEDGRVLVERYECNRCHEGTGLEAPAPSKRCTGCHEEIAAGRFEAPPAAMAKWKPRVAPLRRAPSLSRVGALIEPKWVSSYLTAPFDLRPALHPQMPRLDLDARRADAIARWLASRGETQGALPPDDRPSSPAAQGDADRGRRAFASRKCDGCHAFSGAGFAKPTESIEDAAHALAPDLAFSRARLRRDRVAAWIRDPRSIAADASMPKQEVTEAEAADLVAFVFEAPLDERVERPAASRLPLLDRAVRYDEVAERVLHRICWHCHAQPDFARGDGGPGHTGGFGFTGRGLDLSTYEAVSAGYRDARGEPTSLFAPAENGEPMLLGVLHARQEEERGRAGAVRGMPLGLPPLSDEDVQLVASWIAQGHPR